MGCVVSFYSFKGGTGRSTGLSNVAYELASRGASVGCMDFDLSAPGLHWIYEVGPNRLMNTRSIHDRLDPNKVDSDLDDYVVDLTRSYRDENIDGDLLLMPGDMNAKVAAEAHGGGSDGKNDHLWGKVKALISDFEANYDLDYVFLDSRSGISNQSMPLFQQADVVLAFTKWTHQHKKGTYELFDWIFNRPPLEFDNVFCVGSNIPESVPQSDFEEWVTHDLHHKVSDSHLISESELLKRKERILTQEEPDSHVAQQYGELATILEEQ